MNTIKIVLSDARTLAAGKVALHMVAIPVAAVVAGLWPFGLIWFAYAVAVYATQAKEGGEWAFKWFVARTLIEGLLMALLMAGFLILPV